MRRLLCAISILGLTAGVPVQSVSLDTSAPQLKPQHAVCECRKGIILNNDCYSTFDEAISDSRDGDTIHIGGVVVEVSESIRFLSSITIQGQTCEDDVGRSRILATSSFESRTGAILEAINPDGQSVVLKNLEVTSELEGQFVAAFHSIHNYEAGTERTSQEVQLVCNNVHIHDMQSELPGVGVYLMRTEHLILDDQCIFENLIVNTTAEDMWPGGPAVAVNSLGEHGVISLDGIFKNNRAHFPHPGTRHSGGGAVYLGRMSGNVNISAQFMGNQANQGGALHILGLYGSLYDSGVYTNNTAAEEGNGSRAGVIFITKLEQNSSVVLEGMYTNNTSGGRGGVIGTNVHSDNTTFILNGTFRNNRAQRGGMWGRWSSTHIRGFVRIDIASNISDNISEQDNDRTSVYNVVTSGNGSDEMSQVEWQRRTESVIINPPV